MSQPTQRSCCVPNCTVKRGDGVLLHRFPNPNNSAQIERFRTWVMKIGGDIIGEDNTFIYRNRKICHRHFEEMYIFPNNKLTSLAIPSLHIPGVSNSEHKKFVSQTPEPAVECGTNTNSGLPSTSAKMDTCIPSETGCPKMTHASSILPKLGHFDCEGDPTSVATRWKKWKRAFEIYLLAANIDTPVNKLVTLLHVGGIELQEIYYNLPEAHTEETGVDVYTTALEKLDCHFTPKRSRIYERYLFRLTKQEEGEQFERFLLKLRNQAERCQFQNKEEQIIDQITEKCNLDELREKIFECGDTITLDEIIRIAKALEVGAGQSEQFKIGNTNNKNSSKKAKINKIGNKRKYNKPSNNHH